MSNIEIAKRMSSHKITGARYIAVVLGLIAAAELLQRLKDVPDQLENASIFLYGFLILISLTLILFGMFYMPEAKLDNIRARFIRIGPTLIGMIGLGLTLILHDGGSDRVIAVIVAFCEIVAVGILVFVIRRITTFVSKRG